MILLTLWHQEHETQPITAEWLFEDTADAVAYLEDYIMPHHVDTVEDAERVYHFLPTQSHQLEFVPYIPLGDYKWVTLRAIAPQKPPQRRERVPKLFMVGTTGPTKLFQGFDLESTLDYLLGFLRQELDLGGLSSEFSRDAELLVNRFEMFRDAVLSAGGGSIGVGEVRFVICMNKIGDSDEV